MGIERTLELATLHLLSCRAMYVPVIRAPHQPSKRLPLINRHTAWYRSVRKVWHFHHVWFFVIVLHLPTCNVWLESFSKVGCAHDRVDNSNDYQDNGNDSKSCE